MQNDALDAIYYALVLDLSKRVAKLEEAAKVTEQQPKTPPTPIAQVGEVWVNRTDLNDYAITAVEVVGDLVIYTADVNGRELRIGQEEMEREFVRRAADVTVQQLRRIAGQLNELSANLYDFSAHPKERKELRDLAQEITTNIIPHIQFIGAVE